MQAGPSSRATRQRAAIVDALSGADTFLSAQDLHALLRDRGAPVGLTTVYRNLQSMSERGEIDVVRRGDGEALYRMCRTDTHHHHLVCRRCGFSVEIESDEVERWTRRVTRRHRFSEVSHDLELFGLCAECATGR